MYTEYLRYFMAVAKYLSFTKAAAALYMAQPALSLKIRRLESELGTVLFQRTKRSVRLTSAGYVLLAEGEKLEKCMREARDKVKAAAAYGDGNLQIALLGAVAPELLPLVKAFRARYPRIRLEPQVMNLQELHEALVRQRVDLAVTVENNAFCIPNLEVRQLQAEALSLVLATDHPFHRFGRDAFWNLAQEPFLLFSSADAPQYHQQVIELCAGWGFFPRIEGEFTALEELLFRVAAGYGVSLLPLHVRTCAAVKLHLKFIPLEQSRDSLQRIVAWDKNRKNPAIFLFYQMLLAEGAK